MAQLIPPCPEAPMCLPAEVRAGSRLTQSVTLAQVLFQNLDSVLAGLQQLPENDFLKTASRDVWNAQLMLTHWLRLNRRQTTGP